jgi:hypothetical protein
MSDACRGLGNNVLPMPQERTVTYVSTYVSG